MILVHSSWGCQEVHSRLWSNFDIQQSPSWTKPILQLSHATRSVHWVVWSVVPRYVFLSPYPFVIIDRIDENLKNALQTDLDKMAPGLQVQVN